MDKRTVIFDLIGRLSGQKFSELYEQFKLVLSGTDADRAQFEPVLMITSGGGTTQEAIAFYTFFRQFSVPITTVAVGSVNSAAVLVYLAGERRLALPGSTFLIHEGKVTLGERTPRQAILALRNTRKQVREYDAVLERVVGDRKLVRRWLSSEYVLSAEEALRHGIVHEIVQEPFFKGRTVRFAAPPRLPQTPDKRPGQSS